MEQKAMFPSFKFDAYHGICLDWLRKITKNLNNNSRSPAPRFEYWSFQVLNMHPANSTTTFEVRKREENRRSVSYNYILNIERTSKDVLWPADMKCIYDFHRCTVHFEFYEVQPQTNALFINLAKSFKFTLKYTIISLLNISVFNDHHQGALSVPD